MKKLTSIIVSVILIMSLLLTGCSDSASKKAAEKAVDNMFLAFMEFDFAEANKYIDIENTLDLELDKDTLSKENQELMEAMFKNLSYEILSSKYIDINTVEVTVGITNTDMAPVLRDFASALTEYAYSTALFDTETTDYTDKIVDIFIECLSSEDTDTVTFEVNITVKKVDGSWQVQPTDTLKNALLGGFLDASKNN